MFLVLPIFFRKFSIKILLNVDKITNFFNNSNNRMCICNGRCKKIERRRIESIK